MGKNKKPQEQEKKEKVRVYGVDFSNTWEIQAEIQKRLDAEGTSLKSIDSPGINKFRALKNKKLKI